MTKIEIANIVTAFAEKTVGTKVVDKQRFWDITKKTVAEFDFAGQRVPGLGYIPCNELVPTLSAGVGNRTHFASDYHPVSHRGRIDLYLKRNKAAKIDGAALVVYTRETYFQDPDVQRDTEECERIKTSDCTHVLVTVLSFAGPKAPFTPYRLVGNLTGDSLEAQEWTREEVTEQAKISKGYWDAWCVVAD